MMAQPHDGRISQSKVDVSCDISPRAPRLRVHQTGSRGGAEARRQERRGSGRLARHGRPGQRSIYLRTAIIRYAPLDVGLMKVEHLQQFSQRLVLLIRVEHVSRSRRLARHRSARSASSRASNRLTRRRGGAEIGSAVLTIPVGRCCTRRRKRAPRATRRSQTGFNVSENCYNPVC